MQKCICLATAGIWLLALTVCGSKNEPLPHMKAAYIITEKYTHDIDTAGQMGAHEKELLENGTAFLASTLNLCEDELLDGITAILLDADVPLEHIAPFIENHGIRYFALFETKASFACVNVVNMAYHASGKIDEVITAME